MIVVEKDGKILAVYGGDWNINEDKLIVNGEEVLFPTSKYAIHEVPEQDVSHLYHEDEFGGSVIVGKWPDDIPKRYTDEEIAAMRKRRIDCETGKAINEAIHPFAGLEEQIGILRAQIAEILVASGLEPTDEFAKLNAIAAEKIQEARKKKGIIDANTVGLRKAQRNKKRRAAIKKSG